MISVDATTSAVMKCCSMYLLKARPMTPAGIQETMTFFQSSTVSFFSVRVFHEEKGLSRSKFSTTTDRIAPSWITTRNISMKAFDTSSLMNSSTRII